MDNVADVTFTGESANNYFGLSVSSAGDLNGDGYSDIVTGAKRYNSYTGKAYVYFGSSSMDNTADLTLTGETTSNFFLQRFQCVNLTGIDTRVIKTHHTSIHVRIKVRKILF